MNLSEYCAERGAQAALADALGVDSQLVNMWCKRRRPVPPARCPSIESATGRKVMRWDLRPKDWHEHWPELRRLSGAPKVKL